MGVRTRFRGVRNVALDTQWLESLVGARRQNLGSHMMDGWGGGGWLDGWMEKIPSLFSFQRKN